jgi:hypothetical protein
MEFFALRVTSRVWVRSMALLLLSGGALAGFQVAAIGQQNPIQVENARPGTTAWQLSNPSNESEEGSPIEGYASATSVNRGDQISFFVRTTSPTFTIAIYRLGWYGGLGGRQEMAPVQLSAVAQPLPTPDPTYFSVECNWTSSFTLTTSNPSDPTDWVSGIYVAKLTASSGNDRYIIFVVRDDSRSSSLVYQQSVNTSQAYNAWGGTSLYSSSPRAVKVSFNRPYDDGWGTGLFLSYEFDMVGFLESEGYDVSYTTDVDTHERGNLLTNHKGFLVVGHDEYWSLEMRQNVTAARDAGVGLGFFSADTMYWQIRYEPSPITGVTDRTIVGYKETAAQDDPDASNPATYPLITTAFRNVHGDLPGQPEDAVVGIMYNSEEPASGDIIVENTGTWIFANTGLSDGDHLPGILGYEVDALFNDATTPADIIDVAHSPYVLGGQSFAADSSVYQAASGAWVFATGSVEWDWGLNDISPWGPTSSLVNAATQQITRNVLNQFISGTVITPSPTPSGVPTARPTPKPTPTATPKPTPTPVPTPTPKPTPTPSPISTPTPIPTPTLTPIPTPTLTPIPTPTPTPVIRALRFGPNPVFLPNTVLGVTGATSAPVQVHLKDPSGSPALPITLEGMEFVGPNSGDFAIQSSTCPPVMTPGLVCFLNLTFTPSGLGLRTARLKIFDNASNRPQVFHLSGYGVRGRLPRSPTELFFGKVAKGSGKALPITLTNPQSVALSITSIAVKGLNAPEFGEIDNCVGTLGAGNSCTITVTFAPTAVGHQYAKVKIFDAARRSPQVVPAQGWGTK